jgi:hypothetical protein
VSTFPYGETAADVRELLNEFGRAVTISKRASTSPVGEPWEDGGAEAETSVEVNAVFLDELIGMTPDNDADRTWIGTILVEPPATGEDLSGYDLIRDGSRHVELASVAPLKPGDLTVLYVARKVGG